MVRRTMAARLTTRIMSRAFHNVMQDGTNRLACNGFKLPSAQIIFS